MPERQRSRSYSTVKSWMNGTRENSATATAIIIFSVIVYPYRKYRVSLLNSMDDRGSIIT
ncbi:MAG: hypothetical protein HGA55_01000 [Methanoregulaceae archaeon]|nr:hypothetical protein [Methanoregulaceae archaeon]